MTFLSQPAAASRLRWVTAGVVLALVIPATTTLGAEAPTDGSLCDTLRVERLNALGPIQFDDPEVWTPALCLFEASSGSSLFLSISGISFELMRSSSPDLVELMVGDRPAVSADDGSVHIGLDEGILSIGLTLGELDDASGIDQREYAIDVAEIVVPALDASRTTDDEPASAGSLVRPPEVAGISWGRWEVAGGEELFRSGEEQAAVWQPLLDSVGVDATQFFLVETTASDADSGERLGSYSVIQLVGIDGSRLRPAIVEWLRTTSGLDVGTEDVTLGGKQLIALSFDGELQGYLYFTGDTAHALTMPEEAAARVLERIP